MIGLLNPYVWGGALLVLAISNGATFWKTWSWRDGVHHDAVLVARAEAESRVREEERTMSDATIRVERNSVELLKMQVVTASQSIEEAKHALQNVPKCPIARDVVRVLQPSTARLPVRKDPATSAAPNAAAAGPGAVPRAEGTDEPVTAADLLEVCNRNYEKICIPNKIQVLGLQAYVNDVCLKN
jgi:hypothetical protein